MQETMGQIIRKLRKEKNLTQEDLALQLGITYQAVSKWENDAGMPDVSQIVPLAHIFGVSTDVLFGIAGVNDKQEVMKIIRRARSLLSRPLSTEGMCKRYAALQEGLKLYPGNTTLILECLEAGVGLSYPESTVYDAENAKKIYKECIHYANLVISYSANTTDVLRAHMIMVLLHSAYGDFNQAKSHIQHFPWRADFNLHVMYAYYAHWKEDYETEAQSCQYGVLYYLDALLNILLHLGKAYANLNQSQDAILTLETALALINCLFHNEEILPPVHHREQGDLFQILAELYIKEGNIPRTLEYLSKMVEYDTDTYDKIHSDIPMHSPLIKDIQHKLYRKPIDRYQLLRSKLTAPCFSMLTENEAYQQLLQKAGL